MQQQGVSPINQAQTLSYGDQMKSFLFLSFLLLSSQVFAAYGEFTDESLIPPASKIKKIETFVYDLVKEGYGKECGDTQCFRIDVQINGTHVATWIASPGKPHPGTDFKGNYTPEYHSGVPYSRKKRQGANYVNRHGDPMPWAAFWERNDRGTPVIATHAGRVTGRRESHGCVRLHRDKAKRIYQWVGAAMKNGGIARAYTKDTIPR